MEVQQKVGTAGCSYGNTTQLSYFSSSRSLSSTSPSLNNPVPSSHHWAEVPWSFLGTFWLHHTQGSLGSVTHLFSWPNFSVLMPSFPGPRSCVNRLFKVWYLIPFALCLGWPCTFALSMHHIVKTSISVLLLSCSHAAWIDLYLGSHSHECLPPRFWASWGWLWRFYVSRA